MARYSWREKSQINLDAEKCGARVEALRKKLGGDVTPQALLDDAKDEKSPLHDGFEWSDRAAAAAYRLQQAGHILRSLIIEVTLRPGNTRQMRAFVSVERVPDRPTYTSLESAMSDKELRAQIVGRAWRELISWRERYIEYKELARMAGLVKEEYDRAHPQRRAAE